MPHRLDVSLHPVHIERKAIDEPERLRVFCQHRCEHAGDNVTKSSDAPILGLTSPASAWPVTRAQSATVAERTTSIVSRGYALSPICMSHRKEHASLASRVRLERVLMEANDTNMRAPSEMGTTLFVVEQTGKDQPEKNAIGPDWSSAKSRSGPTLLVASDF